MAKKGDRRVTASRPIDADDESDNDTEGRAADDTLAAGYVTDFVSGVSVRATPEEIQAVQVFSRRLVEDFGYPISHIITRPQYRVRRRPSETKKSYPVDIAVFKGKKKNESDLLMVVECKSENVKVGRKQLEIYLSLCDAEIGVWFNGDSHLYLRKQYVEGGRVIYSELPTLPKFGQRVEDIGLYARRDLLVSEQLKSVLRDIRNHLAGNVTGITRRAIAP